MTLAIRGIPTEQVEAIRGGGPDANGQPAVTRIELGVPSPCRHCLGLIGEGEEKLVLAYRPFDAPQPYAETGPIFLHATACPRYAGDALPGWFALMDTALVRGYGADHWIRYDTGAALPGAALGPACERILADPAVAYAHVRSKFGCFQCRVERE